MHHAETLERAVGRLRGIHLPLLVRPPLGPKDPPTVELVRHDLMVYGFCSVAYLRDLLTGLLALLEIGNVPGTDLSIRCFYEWAMQAAYVQELMRPALAAGDFPRCREVMYAVQAGNLWFKRHGDKYAPNDQSDEVPGSVRINRLVEAYKRHQRDLQGEESVADDYGFLSEHAHPSGACLSELMLVKDGKLEIHGPVMGTRSGGLFMASLIDWAWCTVGILGLAEERVVRKEMRLLLESLIHKGSDVL